jgi:hypothetical protein
MKAMEPRDTHPRIERMIIEGYRRMTPAQKLARVFDLSLAVRQLSAARIRNEHPELDERTVQERVAELCYGPDLVRRALGRPPK